MNDRSRSVRRWVSMWGGASLCVAVLLWPSTAAVAQVPADVQKHLDQASVMREAGTAGYGDLLRRAAARLEMEGRRKDALVLVREVAARPESPFNLIEARRMEAQLVALDDVNKAMRLYAEVIRLAQLHPGVARGSTVQALQKSADFARLRGNVAEAQRLERLLLSGELVDAPEKDRLIARMNLMGDAARDRRWAEVLQEADALWRDHPTLLRSDHFGAIGIEQLRFAAARETLGSAAAADIAEAAWLNPAWQSRPEDVLEFAMHAIHQRRMARQPAVAMNLAWEVIEQIDARWRDELGPDGGPRHNTGRSVQVSQSYLQSVNDLRRTAGHGPENVLAIAAILRRSQDVLAPAERSQLDEELRVRLRAAAGLDR